MKNEALESYVMGINNEGNSQQKHSSHRTKLPEMARSGGVALDPSDTGSIGSNSTHGNIVYPRSLCVVLSCGDTGFATSRSPVQEILPSRKINS
jgi:hypothetical protein